MAMYSFSSVPLNNICPMFIEKEKNNFQLYNLTINYPGTQMLAILVFASLALFDSSAYASPVPLLQVKSSMT